MVQLTKFSYTKILEEYHSVLNKCTPKNTHFFYRGMVANCKLAAIDINQGETLEQAKMKNGDDHVCYNVMFVII